MTLTIHAKKRQKQRCISHQVIQYLILFGSKQYDGHGAIKLFFDKKAKNKLIKNQVNLSNKQLNIYAIKDCSTNTIITTGHRSKKIQRR